MQRKSPAEPQQNKTQQSPNKAQKAERKADLIASLQGGCLFPPLFPAIVRWPQGANRNVERKHFLVDGGEPSTPVAARGAVLFLKQSSFDRGV